MFSDNHVHTPYCLHGSDELMEEYVKSAIEKGLKKLTFTEHAPLPIEDTTPEQDSTMKEEEVEAYLKNGRALQEKYKNHIDIQLGFEVDYIEGKEAETAEFLMTHPETIPHSILSVHFVKLPDNAYFCIDYDKDYFLDKAEEIGYAELAAQYERTLHKALSLPYGENTPKRIGHVTLIHKFQLAHDYSDSIQWTDILNRAKENGYTLDYNFAGLDKPYCKETYPNEELIIEAKALGIPLSYGSDAHHPSDVGRYFERGLYNG